MARDPVVLLLAPVVLLLAPLFLFLVPVVLLFAPVVRLLSQPDVKPLALGVRLVAPPVDQQQLAAPTNIHFSLV